MKTSPSDLIDDLVQDTKSIMKMVKNEFLPLDQESLLLKPDPYRWSIGECLEHLNLYSDYYHPIIRKKMEEAGPCNSNYTFKSGMAGNFFAKSMLPKKKMMKMSSPGDKNPSKTGVPDEVIKRFLAHQKDLLQLLATARNRDLNKIRIPLSLSKLIRFKLGDTFRFVVNHNQRHVVQAIGNLER